jgi:tetratricopeptide (TPR) repeat protein
MNTDEIGAISNRIYACLKSKHLKEALDLLKGWIDACQIPFYSEMLDELDNSYMLMLKYVVEGAEDPQRETVYRNLIRKTYRMTDTIREELLFKHSKSYEYAQLHFFQQNSRNLSGIIVTLEEQSVNRSVAELLENGLKAGGKESEFARQHEQTRLELFRHLWLSTELDAEQFHGLLQNTSIEEIDKSFAISALTLNILRFFNEDRIRMLATAALNPLPMVRQRALVGLTVVLGRYDDRLPFYDSIVATLQTLAEDAVFLKSFASVVVQFIRTAETDIIARKMEQEIIPEMMKIAPQIKDKIDFDSLTGNEELEDKNPEWQEMIENSGVADKLREMSELQMEGADVYLNTFAQLKYYPFFGEIGNWFLPFDPEHTDIHRLMDGEIPFLKLLLDNSFLCNSDKYSLTLSMLQIPDSQRKSMIQAFKMENEQIQEVRRAEKGLSSDDLGRQYSNQYIQDLYRFCKLYPYRSDFAPVFDMALRLHQKWFFAQLPLSEEQQTGIAEFYFAKGHYREAFEMFERLGLQKASPELYQKMGYCRQQEGAFTDALDYYLRAEALQPAQKWLIRKIAYCYKMTGNAEDALGYYRRAAELDPENRNIQLQIGHLLVQRRQYADALNAYFRIELASPEPKVWRAIAWCSFLSGKLSQAAGYYARIIAQKPSKIDYLNAGHVAWALHNRSEALAYYSLSLQMFEDTDDFYAAFEADIPQLLEAGIAGEEVPLMMDKLRYGE